MSGLGYATRKIEILSVSIYHQPNAWLCGPFALKHALLTLGIFENEWTIARAAGTNPSGTDERDLASAARQYGCELRMIRKSDPEDACEELAHHLEVGHPTLLCTEQWDHWVTAVHHESGRFVIFDSRSTAVIAVLDWDQLMPKWRYRESEDTHHFDLHPVVPRSALPRAEFSIDRVNWLARPENAGLARQWGDYARLLVRFGRSGTIDQNLDMFSRPATELVRERQSGVTARMRDRLGEADAHIIERSLDRLCFVADAYALSIPAESEGSFVGAVEDFLVSRIRIARPPSV